MNDTPPLGLWAEAFAWTLAIETPIYWLWLRKRMSGWWAPVMVSLLVNVATHPGYWYLVPQWEPYHEYLVVTESVITLVEGLMVWGVLVKIDRSGGGTGGEDRSRRSAELLAWGIAASFCANTVSTVVGLKMFG